MLPIYGGHGHTREYRRGLDDPRVSGQWSKMGRLPKLNSRLRHMLAYLHGYKLRRDIHRDALLGSRGLLTFVPSVIPVL